MSRSRAQEWSKRAFASVRAMKAPGIEKSDASKYRTACMKMPGLVHQSGLLQSLVFMVARDAQGARYADDLAAALAPGEDHEELIARAQAAPLVSYLALTRDVLEVAQWLRRFAQIELAQNEPGDARG